MLIVPNLITKDYLIQHYWSEGKSVEDIAKEKGVSASFVKSLIKVFGVTENPIPKDDRFDFKELQVYRNHKGKVLYFNSFSGVAKFLKISEEDVKNAFLKTERINGFLITRKMYRGEIIAERRRDFQLTDDFESVAKGLTSHLPEYPKKERIEHYNEKLKGVFAQIA